MPITVEYHPPGSPAPTRAARPLSCVPPREQLPVAVTSETCPNLCTARELQSRSADSLLSRSNQLQTGHLSSC